VAKGKERETGRQDHGDERRDQEGQRWPVSEVPAKDSHPQGCTLCQDDESRVSLGWLTDFNSLIDDLALEMLGEALQ
jgi:hypothetical protein